MANCNERARRKKTRAQERSKENKKNPMLTFCLFDNINIRETAFDSMGQYHKKLMQKVGPIALIPFNFPLNGSKGAFEKVLKGNGDFLLLHSEHPLKTSQQEWMEFENILVNIRRQKRKFQIFATPFVAKKIGRSFNYHKINDTSDIIDQIRRVRHEE